MLCQKRDLLISWWEMLGRGDYLYEFVGTGRKGEE